MYYLPTYFNSLLMFAFLHKRNGKRCYCIR